MNINQPPAIEIKTISNTYEIEAKPAVTLKLKEKIETEPNKRLESEMSKLTGPIVDIGIA